MIGNASNNRLKANLAPTAAANLAWLKTHTDLAIKLSITSNSDDQESDNVFLRVLNTTYGTGASNNQL